MTSLQNQVLECSTPALGVRFATVLVAVVIDYFLPAVLSFALLTRAFFSYDLFS